MVYGARRGVLLDHINHDGLDNRRVNLRPATSSQNQGNSRINKSGRTSRYRGVSFHKASKKWRVRIGSGRQGTQAIIGYYADEAEAARAYDAAAIEHWGEFAARTSARGRRARRPPRPPTIARVFALARVASTPPPPLKPPPPPRLYAGARFLFRA
ncbi:MAG: hypothetical protein IPK85_02755 [Gemmatimonadetes bacterium]|nr:hypothetical protein [Gemmatimonadota bacterium]